MKDTVVGLPGDPPLSEKPRIHEHDQAHSAPASGACTAARERVPLGRSQSRHFRKEEGTYSGKQNEPDRLRVTEHTFLTRRGNNASSKGSHAQTSPRVPVAATAPPPPPAHRPGDWAGRPSRGPGDPGLPREGPRSCPLCSTSRSDASFRKRKRAPERHNRSHYQASKAALQWARDPCPLLELPRRKATLGPPMLRPPDPRTRREAGGAGFLRGSCRGGAAGTCWNLPVGVVRVPRASTVRAWTQVPSSGGQSSAAGKPPPAPRCCQAGGVGRQGGVGLRRPAARASKLPLSMSRFCENDPKPPGCSRAPAGGHRPPTPAAAQGSAAGSACGLCAQTRPPRGRQPTPGAPAQRRPLPSGVRVPGRATRTPAIPRAVARSRPHMSRPREPPRTAAALPPRRPQPLRRPGSTRPHPALRGRTTGSAGCHAGRPSSAAPAVSRAARPAPRGRCSARTGREAGAAVASTTRRGLGARARLPPSSAPRGSRRPPRAPAPSASPGAALGFPPAQAPGLPPRPAAVVLGRTSAGGGQRGRGSRAVPAAAPAQVHRRSLARPAPARSLAASGLRLPQAGPARPGNERDLRAHRPPGGLFVETRECPAPDSAARPCLSEPPAALRVGPWNSRPRPTGRPIRHTPPGHVPRAVQARQAPAPSGVRCPSCQGATPPEAEAAMQSCGPQGRTRGRCAQASLVYTDEGAQPGVDGVRRGLSVPPAADTLVQPPSSRGPGASRRAHPTAPPAGRSNVPLASRARAGPAVAHQAPRLSRDRAAPGGRASPRRERLPRGEGSPRAFPEAGSSAPSADPTPLGSGSASRPMPRAGHGAPPRPSKTRPRLAMQNFTPAGCVHSGSPVPTHKSPQAPVARLEEHPRGRNSGRDTSPTAAAALGLSSQCRRDTNTLSGEGP
ncbi:nascent polypeptide-associated complex subunit alpha, muscle-specific form-like [Lontra canadensis]|uniref:nascent polypeptide-associated complex subunit alpha, muscle-specific form-like n=1 Tax=Lontra canadensis TaxID=76717 RepID=UPI0013F320DD|nr:nascent polypeptide-associated complex subunit alpha, muscle-specific form-like [Lontra canadensis]